MRPLVPLLALCASTPACLASPSPSSALDNMPGVGGTPASSPAPGTAPVPPPGWTWAGTGSGLGRLTTRRAPRLPSPPEAPRAPWAPRVRAGRASGGGRTCPPRRRRQGGECAIRRPAT